jgi:predicted permease
MGCNVESGQSQDAQAERHPGNATVWGVAMSAFWQDLHYSLRLFVKSKAFTSVAILSLALGIGANTAIFSLVNAVFLRELPVRAPQHLVVLTTLTHSGERNKFSVPVFREIERQQRVFSGVYAWWGDGIFNIDANGTLSQGDVWAVTGAFYSELGIAPQAGRLLVPEDVQLDRGTPGEVAVIGYSLWQRSYSGDPSAVGKTIRIEGMPFRIVGITRKGFTGTGIATEPDVTIPLTAQPMITDGNVARLSSPRWIGLEIGGRLKDGDTLAQARAQLGTLWPSLQATALASDYTEKERALFVSSRLEVKSAARGVDSDLRETYSRPLCVMLGAAGLILLIACVNLANLMLGRAGARRHEMAVRRALGAGSWRIIRQLLTESVLLSVAGATLGLGFAFWSTRWLTNFIMQLYVVPVALNVTPDARVLGFTSAATVFTGVLFGLAPGWQATRQEVTDLQQGSRIPGRRPVRFGGLLISAQVALSVILLIGAGLFIRTVDKLRSVKTGFRDDGVLVVKLSPVPAGYKNIDNDSYYPELVRRVSALPGVRAACIGNIQPGGGSEWTQSISASASSVAANEGLQAGLVVASPGFFNTLGIPLLQGRDVEWQDDAHRSRVAVLSRKLAQQLFHSEDPMGRRIRIGSDPARQDIQIVGVVSDARLSNVRNPNPMVAYVPFLQEPKYIHSNSLEILTEGDPTRIANVVRHEIESLGHEYPTRMITLPQVRDRALLQERILAVLTSFFSVLALLLASVGLYGLLSYTVTLRTREIGVRMALGARRMKIFRMILRDTLVPVAIGLTVGLPSALTASRFIAHMLFDVASWDPVTLTVVVATLVVVAVAAGSLPARRASSLDPMIALREE